jgi:peptidylprolyl isomerase
MRYIPLLAAALALSAPALAADPPAPSPVEIVAAAPAADWVAIASSDLLVMDLAADARGRARRVVIQLMPAPFSQGWIGNIRTLAAAHWWDGLSINRVQDNYVAQWGDAEGDDSAKARALPPGLAVVPESGYASIVAEANLSKSNTVSVADWAALTSSMHDPYAHITQWQAGWPVGSQTLFGVTTLWPVHCYGMVGVGRDLSPNTGSGAELYTVIGHAPRHLDRNIALVGRVIAGIEHLSSLPRGTGPLGFYESAEERTGITSVRIGSEVAGLPAYQYLSTESGSFWRYADARANRRDPFFIRPAGGADICNIPVPVRRVQV